MISLIVQTILTIVTTLVAWAFMGPVVYITIASIIAIACVSIVVRRQVLDTLGSPADQPPSPIWFVISLGLSFVLGAFWTVFVCGAAWVGGRNLATGESRSVENERDSA